MNKYIKAFLIFLFYWVIVGTGFAIILSLIASGLSVFGMLIGVALGIYFAYKTIKK